MGARPARWWDTASGRRKIERNEAAFDEQSGHSNGFRDGWTICPCHGRRLLWSKPWTGLRR